MWGNTQTLTIDHSIAIIQSSTTQLVRIAYGRPETWTFFFRASIVGCSENDDSGQLDVDWSLSIGTGRSHVTLPRFEQYIFQWTGVAPSQPIGLSKYSGQVITPVRNDALVAPNPGIMTDFVAQDIQLQATLAFSGGAIPVKTIDVQLDAFFAPKSHVRPEWFRGEFSGGEDHGQ
jgi:hypothetical protein